MRRSTSIGNPFQNECGTQEQRLCASHGQIVDRSMHRQRSDVATRKEQRLHHERISRKGKPGTVHLDDRLIVQSREDGILKRGKEDFADQCSAQGSAAAVSEQHCISHRQGGRADEIRDALDCFRHSSSLPSEFGHTAGACRRYR
jgi:hypothetical protein